MIEVSWTEFKTMISNNIKWIYTSQDSNYIIFGSFGSIDVKCFLKQGTDDFTEFENSYKNKLPKLYDIDDQGRQITRLAYAQSGWTYMAHPIEFETSTLGSLFNSDFNSNDRNSCTIKFYDANNNEVTNVNDEASITKTVVLFKPSYDYEMISGSVRQVTKPSTAVRLWVVGGIIELGVPYIKEFAGGLNLQYIGEDEELKTDGRSSKYMVKTIQGVAYQGNQLQIIVRHNAGVKHKIMVILEYYKA